ncbi:hypothetical protein FGE12_15375 [Aggregicoccus sp. 17bor-14]|uniref:DUF6130 family protein n=1 Tax=Myxococcaceae TaxID=31 RepID=UPI00129C6899|nr:hypothetical protein [Simulacricoccus sp. 17bor-14]MRI89531.1 hypothetical protein [Aggregicoccus sp. 17bor-14]
MASIVSAVATTAEGADKGAAPPQATEMRVANPYAAVDQEPPPELTLDPPDPKALRQGVVWIQYQVQNLRILPVFGKEAVAVSPRVGHLHIIVDDLPWWWAHTSDINTIDLAGLPPGEHQVQVMLVNPNHETFPGQTRTVKFTVPAEAASASHR